jgi:hypothetical protein
MAVTSLPHRVSLSPSWAHRFTITRSGSPRSLLYLGNVLHSRRAERTDSYAPPRHGRYITTAPCSTPAERGTSIHNYLLRLTTAATFTSVPCFNLAELSVSTITPRLATAATSLPHRASLSPSWAHRFTITCSGSPRSILYLCTVLHSRRAEHIDNYAPPRHGRYITTAPCFTLAELGTSIHNYLLRLTTVATLPLHRASLSPS